jgi:hypothetical protein
MVSLADTERRNPMSRSCAGSSRRLRLPIRYYQVARQYGPGMEPSGEEGLHERMIEKPADQVGLVSVHCWNVGEETGPYPIGSNAHCPGEAADKVPTALEIIDGRIAPVMRAARGAGVAIFHLAHPVYADRYSQYLAIAMDPEIRSPSLSEPPPGCVRPWTLEEQWTDEFGRDFPGGVWETHAGMLDIARSVRPLPEDYVIVDGWQLNALCRRMDIDTLFYVGFAADLCLVNVPGAIREMSRMFRYRCIALRDCTVAHEFEDTYEGNWMSRAAIRLIELDLGYSATSLDFVAACEGAPSP